MGKRVMVLSASVGSGHNIAAGALEVCFREAPGVDAVQSLDTLELTSPLYRKLYDEAYFALVDAAPWLVGWSYDQNNPPFRDRNMVSLWDRLNTIPVISAIRAFQPDVVVCTHFLPAKLVSLLLAGGALQLRDHRGLQARPAACPSGAAAAYGRERAQTGPA